MSRALADTESITLAQVVHWLRRNWLGVLAGSLVGAVAGIVISLAQPAIYRSQVVLSPNVESMAGAGLGELAGQFGSLAALAGIRMPSGGGKQEAIEYLKSRGLIAQFITDENLLPELFDRKWDPDAGLWRVEGKDVPTLNDGVELFVTRVRRVQEDRGSGMITLTVDWRDRKKAARWAAEIVRRVNDALRAQAVNEAQRSLDYLRRRVEQEELISIRESMFKLIESQTKTIMLANVREQYAFRTVDPPTEADEDDYVSPNRLILTIVGLLLGAVVGLVLSLLRNAVRDRKT